MSIQNMNDKIPFWKEKTLAQLSEKEWESLCDGCGKCCLNKIIDEDTDTLHFTNVACYLLHHKTAQCKKYETRFKLVKNCMKVSLDDIEQFHWLPESCAYRRLVEGKELPLWHPLLVGNKSQMHKDGFSIRGKVISETLISDDNLQDYIKIWPGK